MSQHFSEEIDISRSINYPETSAIVDVDNDGDNDVFCASIGDGKISFFENLGAGNFAEMQIVSTVARSTTHLFFEDLDGDSDLDIISTSSVLGGIIWIENLGSANFAEAQLISTAYSGIVSLKLEDIDNDSDLDIISYSVFSSSNALEIFENLGDATFVLSAQYSDFDEDISLVESGDLNGDSYPDILLNNGLEDFLVFYENAGDGSYLSPDTILIGLSIAIELELIDLDLDGDLDILTGQYVSPGAYFWYENDGDANFGSQIFLGDGLTNLVDIEPRDFDNDGDIDFIALATDVKYIENLGGGNYSNYTLINENLDGLRDISSGDVTGNGFLDIVIASHGLGWEDHLTLFENSGGASFGSPIYFNPSDPDGVGSVSTGDIDGDGDQDFVCVTLHNDMVIWYENDGLGQFNENHITSLGDNSGYRYVQLADLDSDGDLDIITGSSTDNRIAWQANDGSGTFSSMETLTNDTDFPRSFDVNDLDGDGDMDICVASYDDGEILLFMNDGNENFGNAEVLSEDSFQARSVRTADLNEDGIVDIVSCSLGSNGLAWYPGLGNGAFEESIIQFNEDYRDFNIADYNLDGHLDILAIPAGGAPRLFLNDGSEEFQQENQSISAFSSNQIHSMDVDTDGDMDAVLAGSGGFRYTLNNVANGFLEVETLRPYSASFVAMNSADFDGDGDEDLVYADIFSDRVAVLMNLSSMGCTDASACNYDSFASEDDGSCCYTSCGCTNENALNYDPLATCDDGSCSYDVIAFVYFDENNNGIYDSLDYGLANQELLVSTPGLTSFSNSDGYFNFNINDSDELTFSLQEDSLFPFSTTPAQITVNTDTLGWNADTLEYGISNTVAFFELDVNLFTSTNVCLDINPNVISIENNGSAPLELLIEFEKDSLLNLISNNHPIDSINGNTCFLSHSELLPGQSLGLNFYFDIISADNIGDSLISQVNVQGFHLGALVAFGNDGDNEVVECSYDPNDKHVFPEGYGSDHWVQNDTTLEYMIRFQNTGNAPAQNIWIRDSLDMALDLNSFEFLSSSHAVNTSIDPQSRELLFFFEDIMLPDSVNNEPESHGYVLYSIKAKESSQLLTEINNTAHIFFDNNDPIVTNTTWSTLYDCSLFEASFEYSLGQLMASEGDAYQWYFNGAEISGADDQLYFVTEDGFYSVLVSIDFPCSSLSEESFAMISGINSSQQRAFLMYPNPSSDFTIVQWAQSLVVTQIQLLDITGREVLNADLSNGNTALIPTDNISAGSYIVRVFSEQGIFDAKLIVAQD